MTTTTTFTSTLPAIHAYTSNRWLLVNKTTSKIRNKGYGSRKQARMFKGANERIFDATTGVYVR